MGFDYKKYKDHHGDGTQWTSYSDLFMGLAFVFLLLYVTASLRSGTSGLQQQLQYQKVALENEDLKNQLKVYNTLKKEYLETQASPEEEKQYEELMAKLDLLQDEARTEKEKLQAAARENAKKEMALNKYQQMIRNIMNANAIAKARISKRNAIIEEQDTEIESLEVSVEEKKRQIEEREKQIANLDKNLQKKLKELEWSYKNQKLTKKKYEAQLEQAQREHHQRLQVLQAQQAQAEKQLEEVASQLASTEGALQQKEQEARKLAGKLASTEKSYAETVAKMKADYEAQRAQERAAFENEMKKAKMSAAERAAKEAEFRANVAKKERELADKIQGLQGKLAGTESQLAAARAEIEARKNIAREIQKGFAKAGIKAEVDADTGDVTLDFGDHYFDSGKANLKPEMAKILSKAFPIYAKSIMENKKIADKLNSVEIIGFASPTYQGRVIDPKSMDPADKKAVEYNLDLSYQRARSIFQYAFDPQKMKFDHQQSIRPKVKVSGKSFFEAANVNRNIASKDAKEFCKLNDCKKSQRVLIKFTVDQK